MIRSYVTISKRDLKRLLNLAKQDIRIFFERNPRYKQEYHGEEVLIALCQGAAIHFIDKKNGVKDFDIWFFFPMGEKHLPYRRIGNVDFGSDKFGKHPSDDGYVGRRIDVLFRSDNAFTGVGATEGLERYLRGRKTQTSIMLSKKAVVGLWPEKVFGEILWHLN